MSHMNKTDLTHERNTTISYIIGFVLSLVFTAIPYYLVSSKVVTGNRLLTTILSFAVLQMAIQVFFFLHLGRGPKPFYNIVFFVGTVGIILVVVIGSIFIMNNLHYNMSSSDVITKLAQDEAIYQVGGEKTGACQGTNSNHKVVIQDGKVNPLYTNAQLCDTLTIINKDNKTRDIAFGSHPQHTAYGGESDLSVHKDYPKTITLNQAGSYKFHDHLEETVYGFFNVEPHVQN